MINHSDFAPDSYIEAESDSEYEDVDERENKQSHSPDSAWQSLTVIREQSPN